MALPVALVAQACLFLLPYLLQIIALLLAAAVAAVVVLAQITAIFMAAVAVAVELLMALAALAVVEQGPVLAQAEQVEQPV
jgi:hypothetical protein